MSLVRLSFELGMAVSDYNCGITNDHNAIINATFMYLDKVKVTLLTDDELVECYAIIGQMWASVIERPSELSVQKQSVPELSVQKQSVQKQSVQKPSVPEPSVPEPSVSGPEAKEPNAPETKQKSPEPKAPETKQKVPEPKEKSPEPKGKVSFQPVLPSLSSISSSIQLNAKGKVELPPPSGSIQLKSST